MTLPAAGFVNLGRAYQNHGVIGSGRLSFGSEALMAYMNQKFGELYGF